MRECKVSYSDLDNCPYEKRTCCKYCNIQECEEKCLDTDSEHICMWEM